MAQMSPPLYVPTEAERRRASQGKRGYPSLPVNEQPKR